MKEQRCISYSEWFITMYNYNEGNNKIWIKDSTWK